MIKNIIYDFGGVLLNLDFKRSFDAFEKLGYSDFDQMFAQHNADDLFQKLETGKISNEDFYTQLAAIAPQPVTHVQLKDAWNAMLVNYRINSLKFLITLKNNYNLFLLSNTNAIHYDHFSQMLRGETGYQKLENFFSKAWFSHEIKRRKPDVATFEFVLNDAGLEAAETLFIDDSHSNLPNAESIDIKTHLLKPAERIEDLNYSGY